jgi:glycogen debranching enzyme
MHYVIMTRLEEALAVIKDCRKSGFYASSDVYRYEYWTRDLAFCLSVLLDYGFKNDVKIQISGVSNRQKRNGNFPIFYTVNKAAWLKNLILSGRIKPKRNHLFGISLMFNSLFNSVDSTIAQIISTYNYERITGEDGYTEKYSKNIFKAFNYIHGKMDHGFVVGNDWRDLMPELRDKKLLSNQCLLYTAYLLAGMKERAQKLKSSINAEFWNDRYYISSIGSNNMDVFGQSLAVLFDIAEIEKYDRIKESIMSASTPYGIRNMIFYDDTPIDRLKVESCDQYGTIWPFVSYSAVSALLRMGFRKTAVDEFKKLKRLKGFYEFYTIEGKPAGSKEQLWSACSYISAYNELKLHKKE